MNRRRTPGNPDPEAEVVALSPNSLMTSNRFVCEVCNKGFQRDQNLQLHRRGHQLPWKLKRRSQLENKKKVYLCPVETCPHHYRARALGDITGIKKHFFRKHCEKKYKCLKCSKCYAVKSDWTAHMKNCGSNSYKCDCGLVFGRKDTYRSHKAFCEALAAETARVSASHPQLETSSEEDSTVETMNNYQGFATMQHQLQMPPPLGFSPIDHHVPTAGSSLGDMGINYPTSDGFQIMNNNPSANQVVIKNEPNNADFSRALPFEYQALAPQVNNNYSMSQGVLQNYQQQRVNMVGGDYVGDMMGSTMSQLQMGGAGDQALPVDYYYLMPPTRDFLGLSSTGHGGGSSGIINSSTMGDYGVSLGGATSGNFIGPWGGSGGGGGGMNLSGGGGGGGMNLSGGGGGGMNLSGGGGGGGMNLSSGGGRGGGGGMNLSGGGSEWVPRMSQLEVNNNVHQLYGFYGAGPSTSTSRISTGSQGMNMHERE